MTTLFTILSILVIAYRAKKRLLTKVELVLLAIWFIHFVFEESQVVLYVGRFHYDPRYLRPAEFLLWGWLAWGLVHLSEILPQFNRRWLLLPLGLIVIYNSILLIKPRLPVGRRGAYVAACDWAAEKIRSDWQGPVKDEEFVFSIRRYRVPDRPVIDCYSARLPYVVGGRSNGNAVDEKTVELDQADYWIQDLRWEDPPGEGWELMDTFTRGKHKFPLYRRKR